MTQLRWILGLSMLLALASGTAEASGYLYVQSEPAGAQVKVGGRVVGTTPVNVEVATGSHVVELQLDGYQAGSQRVVVKDGEVTRLVTTLKKAVWREVPGASVELNASVGALTILSDRLGAKVSVDGVEAENGAPTTLRGVPAGSRVIRATWQGSTIQDAIIVESDTTNIAVADFSMRRIWRTELKHLYSLRLEANVGASDEKASAEVFGIVANLTVRREDLTVRVSSKSGLPYSVQGEVTVRANDMYHRSGSWPWGLAVAFPVVGNSKTKAPEISWSTYRDGSPLIVYPKEVRVEMPQWRGDYNHQNRNLLFDGAITGVEVIGWIAPGRKE